MVAVFTGLGSGVERGSGATLGGRGLFGAGRLGRTGGSVTVNAANGNLVLRRQDEFLVGQGPDLGIAGTYNSLGNSAAATDDNGDQWRQSTDRRVFGLTGTQGATGSTITRVGEDGAEIVYSYGVVDGVAAYWSREGGGANDKLSFDPGANSWTWTDGLSQITEIYASGGSGSWRIAAQTDVDGNQLSFSYNASGQLARISTQDGSYIDYVWSGSNISAIRNHFVDMASGATKDVTRTTYQYDASNRLSRVRVDLTPDVTTDAAFYDLNYTYDGASKQVRTITSTDGLDITIGYSSAGKVETITEVDDAQQRVTSFAYLSATRSKVTDARGAETLLDFDAKGQLTKVTPAGGGAVIDYEYNAAGDVTKVSETLAAGVASVTTFAYDGRGNNTQVTDPTGLVTTRTYDARNNLVSEQVGGLPARLFVYDSAGKHLSFAISADNRVTRYVYSATGTLTWQAEFAGDLYDRGAAGAAAPAAAVMDAWSVGKQATLTYFSYDMRQNLATTRTWSASVATQTGSTPYALTAMSGDIIKTSMISDEAGRVLYRWIDPNAATPPLTSEAFVYDGLGRLTLSRSAAGATTLFLYNDAARTATTITLSAQVNGVWQAAAGQSAISVASYNRFGDVATLTSQVQTSAGPATIGTQTFVYDKIGVQRVAVDALAQRSYQVTDALGRKVADVDATGGLIEYRYDARSRLVMTMRYANRLTAAKLAELQAANGEKGLADVKAGVTASASDLFAWTIYDAADRVVETIGGDGAVTTYAYDGAGRLVSTKAFAAKLAEGVLAGYRTTPPTGVALPPVTTNKDFVTRSFYNADGQLVGRLNGEGGLSEIVYDGAGRKVLTRAYATLTPSGLREAGTFAQLAAGLASTDRDAVTRWVYDASGQVRYEIDAIGRVTEYLYAEGAATSIGLVRKTVQWASPIGALSAYSVATVSAALSGQQVTRIYRAIYDDAGRLRFSVDAAGSVGGFEYDAAGRVIKTTAFAVQIDMTNRPLTATGVNSVGDWAGQAANAADRRVTRNFYDMLGNLRYVQDAESYLTEYTYDAEGRLASETRYADRFGSIADATTIDQVGQLRAGKAGRGTSYTYDAAGRRIRAIDAEGIKHDWVYSGVGLLESEYLARDTADEAIYRKVYDLAGRLVREEGPDQSVLASYEYDGLGNLTRSVNAAGAATTFAYDRAGRMIATTDALNGVATIDYDALGRSVKTKSAGDVVRYAYFDQLGRVTMSVDGEGYATSTNYTAFGEVAAVRRFAEKVSVVSLTTPPTLPAGRVALTTTYYDALGRATLSVDAEGYATTTRYDAFGQMIALRRHAQSLSVAALTGQPPTVATNGADSETSFSYDKLGHVTATTSARTETDALVESQIFDAYGQQIETTNKVGGKIAYEYTARGLLARETVTITRPNNGGSETIVTLYVYDGRGNRTRMTEAAGRAEQRVTSFTYDKLDRLTQKKSEDWVLAFDGALSPSGGTAWVQPTETYTYDAVGNLTMKVGAAGARAFYRYDALNRLTHEVTQIGALSDAKGALIRRFYDPDGNLKTVLAYGDSVALPGAANAALPDSVGGIVRETRYEYDKRSLLIKEIRPLGLVGRADGAGFSLVGTEGGAAQLAVTQTDYDGFGNAIKATDANGFSTRSYFDLLGRRVTQIDAENARTDWAYDHNSNVTKEIRFATRSAPSAGATAPPAPAGLDGQDRVTEFQYDRLGRRTRETRKLVAVGDLTGAGMTMPLIDATIVYEYNGLGKVTKKTEASGEAFTYVYDDAGRLIEEQRPIYANQDGANVRPVLRYSYDGLNNLVSSRQLANGYAGSESDADRVTRFTYGAGGRLITKTDAMGVGRFYVYDAAGRVIREEYWRMKSDTSYAYEAIGYGYDAASHVIEQGLVKRENDVWNRAGLDVLQMRYNAFGDVSEKGANGALNERFDYDSAGRLWRTTADDGTWKYYLYDKVGNRTATITSAGSALANVANRSLTEILGLWTGGGAAFASGFAAGMAASVTVYDGRNQAREVREPKRELSAGDLNDLSTRRTYNAFGELENETNSSNATLQYFYNTMGRVIETRSPSVEVTGENGVTFTQTPTESSYFDVSGRLIAKRDANGNVTRQTLLAGTGYGASDALVTAVYAADGGVSWTRYDVFGDARVTIDQIGRASRSTFDRIGRLVEQQKADGLIETFVLDQLGQRLWRYNSALGVGYGEVTDYDAQGRVVREMAPGGDVTTYAYSYDAQYQNAGLGAWGSWLKTTIFANSRTTIERTDAFGRNVAKVDMGGETSEWTFNSAGQVVRRTGGTPIEYAYFNTGKLASSVTSTSTGPNWNDWSRDRTDYSYDAAGNVTREFTANDTSTNVYTPGHYDTVQVWGQTGESISYTNTWELVGYDTNYVITGYTNAEYAYYPGPYVNASPHWVVDGYSSDYQLCGWTPAWQVVDYCWNYQVTGCAQSWGVTSYTQEWGVTGYAPNWSVTGYTQQWGITGYTQEWGVTGYTQEFIDNWYDYWWEGGSPQYITVPVYGWVSTPNYGWVSTPVYDWVWTPVYDWVSTPNYGWVSTPVYDWVASPIYGWTNTPVYGWVNVPYGHWSWTVTTPVYTAQQTPVYGYVTREVRTPIFGYIDTQVWREGSSSLVTNQTVRSDQRASYDALGRIKTWSAAATNEAPQAAMTWQYDANGNVRHTVATFQSINDTGSVGANVSQDNWYRYDSVNRVVTSKGVLSNGQIVRGLQGADLFYDLAGQRKIMLTSSEIQAWEFRGVEDYGYGVQHIYGWVTHEWTNREDYTYDALGRMDAVYVNKQEGGLTLSIGVGALRGHFFYDALGRLTAQHDLNAFGQVVNNRAITYNAKGQTDRDESWVKRGADTDHTITTFDYGWGANYALGAAVGVTSQAQRNSSAFTTSQTDNTFIWADGAQQNTTTYRPNVNQGATQVSYFNYEQVGGQRRLKSVTINDGRPRTVLYRTDASGLIVKRDEQDNLASGDPHEYWYRFGGRTIGYVGNNGGKDPDYDASVASRTAAAPTGTPGAFRNGAQTGVSAAEFDQGIGRITTYDQGSTGGGYTVRNGDTLASIAASLWGDSSLWYKIAEANGLAGAAALTAGAVLNIPVGVSRSTYNASTFTPYDPNSAIGDVSPTSPVQAQPPKKNKCGVIGQILLVVIAVVVTLTTGVGGAVANALNLTGTAANVVGGAASAAWGSVVSQSVGVATGIQDKFSWKGVALAAIQGGIGGGGKLGVGGDGVKSAIARAMVADVATQGIAIATGLQSKFSWVSVAAAGAGGGLGNWVGGSKTVKAISSSTVRKSISGMASAIGNAATRSVLEGTDFGDNVMAALPSVIGQTIGNSIAGRISGNGTTAGDGEHHGGLFGAIGDFLGFDGSFGYQGPEGRQESLGGLGHAIGNVIAPPAAAEPVLTGFGAYDGSSLNLGSSSLGAYGSFNDGVYRSGDNASWILTAGGAEETSRFGIGGNGPPPEYMSEQLFPNLPGAPIIGSVLAPLDSFVGLNTFGLMEDTNREVGGTQVSYLYGRLNEINVHPPQYSFNSFESMSWSERSGYVNYLQGYLAAGTLQLQRDTYSFLQGRVDARYGEALRLYEAGRLPINTRLPAQVQRETALGRYVDRTVQTDLGAFYRARDVSFGAGQYVTLNNRQYAADGSYRLPDTQIGRIWMDPSMTPKTINTPQVQGFFAARSAPIGGIVIRPTQLGGSYYIPRPAPHPGR